jgi:hypothetical protein
MFNLWCALKAKDTKSDFFCLLLMPVLPPVTMAIFALRSMPLVPLADVDRVVKPEPAACYHAP